MFLLKQSLNIHGIAHLVTVFKNPKLLLPDYYFNIEDIADHIRIHNDGIGKKEESSLSIQKVPIRGLIFDKDNTLTIPFNNAHFGAKESEHGHIGEIINRCQGQLGYKNVVILSNSAGSSDDVDAARDRSPSKARAYPHADEVESTLNILVLRHGAKKPACVTTVYTHFNDDVSIDPVQKLEIKSIQMPDLCVIGDRLLTDVLFGKMHGCMTVLVDPIDESKDISVVRLVRFMEMSVVLPLLCWYYKVPQFNKKSSTNP